MRWHRRIPGILALDIVMLLPLDGRSQHRSMVVVAIYEEEVVVLMSFVVVGALVETQSGGVPGTVRWSCQHCLTSVAMVA